MASERLENIAFVDKVLLLLASSCNMLCNFVAAAAVVESMVVACIVAACIEAERMMMLDAVVVACKAPVRAPELAAGPGEARAREPDTARNRLATES